MNSTHLLGVWLAAVFACGVAIGVMGDEDLEQSSQSEYCARVLEYKRSVAAGEHPRGHRDYRGLCKWEVQK